MLYGIYQLAVVDLFRKLLYHSLHQNLTFTVYGSVSAAALQYILKQQMNALELKLMIMCCYQKGKVLSA